MKYKAPKDCGGCSVGGANFTVGEDGCIDVPDDGDYAQLLVPHGFIQVSAVEAVAVEEVEAVAVEEVEAVAEKMSKWINKNA